MMDITIIIVNWNTRRLLSQCIDSIYETINGLKFEIIVVDNASTDDSIERITEYYPSVHLIANKENLGFSRAANLAISRGKSNYFLIIHPDIKFLPGAIKNMFNFLNENPKVGVVGGNLVYPDGSQNSCVIAKRSLRKEFVDFGFPIKQIDEKVAQVFTALTKRKASLYWDHKTVTESHSIWNACMMFRKDVINDIGNFSEDLFVWFADTDWCYRAVNAGWKLYYLPDSPVVHYEVQSKNCLDHKSTNYKLDSLPVADLMQKDLFVFLTKHYKRSYIFVSRAVHNLAVIKAKFRKRL